jgi:regulator of protease activity HflC (stomatin/prohibitin superfamily)
MKQLTGLFSFLLVLTAVITAIGFVFGTRIPPGYVGVKQILVGPDQGYQPDALTPGFYASIPYRSRIHVLPARVQILPVSKSGYQALGKDGLDVTTSDGNYVSVAASVVYSLFQSNKDGQDGAHGGPSDLIAKLGLSEGAWKNQIISVASDKLIRNLSSLTASQFYDPFKRNEKLLQAQSEVRDTLKSYGINVSQILLDHYEYVDKRIDEAIFRKNIQNLEEKLNEQKSKLAEAGAKLEQVSAEADARIENLRVEGTNKSLVIRSEAELLEKQKQAQGDLEYAKAQAEVDRLKASVMQNGTASSLYVAKEIAPLVGSLKGGIIEQMDPYNLEQWMTKLEGK